MMMMMLIMMMRKMMMIVLHHIWKTADYIILLPFFAIVYEIKLNPKILALPYRSMLKRLLLTVDPFLIAKYRVPILQGTGKNVNKLFLLKISYSVNWKCGRAMKKKFTKSSETERLLFFQETLIYCTDKDAYFTRPSLDFSSEL